MRCNPPLAYRRASVILAFTSLHSTPYCDFFLISADNQASYSSLLSQLTRFFLAILDDRKRGSAGKDRPTRRYWTRFQIVSSIADTNTGQINRHKSQSTQPTQQAPHQSQHVSRHAPTRQGWAPYSRGRGRRGGAPHRHRTLVLNNAGIGRTPDNTSSPGPSDTDGETRPAPSSNGWVAKRDRHMQLINSAVYDKEAQARAKAMEETRKAKAQRRAEREQTKVLRYAQAARATVSTPAQPTVHQILVNDVPFKIARGGSKLIRVSSTSHADHLLSRICLPLIDDPSTANTTPKRVNVAGVSFVRSKNGNLHRLGAVTSKK